MFLIKKQPALVSTFVPLLLFSSLPHVHSTGSGRSDAMTSIRKGKRLNVRTADGSGDVRTKWSMVRSLFIKMIIFNKFIIHDKNILIL